MTPPRSCVRISSAVAAVCVGLLAWAATGAGGHARAAESRFAVVNLSGRNAPPGLVAEVEREIARLRPNARVIGDEAMHRLLATGESPMETATRLWAEAESERGAGNCPAAVPLAMQAEALTLEQVGINDERDLLKRLYVTLVICEDTLGRAEPIKRAARHLRALLSLPPATLPEELWKRHVENAIAPDDPALLTELHIDSEPVNAQVSINFHGEGVTPHTLAVPRGEVLIEVEKEGYKKAFRRLDVGEAPVRTVFRLAERGRDRMEMALVAMGLVAGGEPPERPRSLSQLAQWARADFVVCLKTDAGRVRLWQFDAERGAFAKEIIDSPYDAATFRVGVLAARATPKAGAVAGVLAPVGRDGRPAGGEPRLGIDTNADGPAAGGTGDKQGGDDDAGLPSTFDEKARRPFTFPRTRAPWWGWLIAAAVAGTIAVLVIRDQPVRSSALEVNAHYLPPR